MNVVFPVAASWVMIFDLESERFRWWWEKNVLVVFMRMFRSSFDLTRRTISSAKNIALILVFSRSTLLPDEFRSNPRLFIKSANNNGERLQPEIGLG